jgi:broad specificity phosphatase PhoE
MHRIDLIRHHNSAGGTDDRQRSATPLGVQQSTGFGELRALEGITYNLVITHGLLRAEETATNICNTMGINPKRVIVPEMFDPVDPTPHSEIRGQAYTKLGGQPLLYYIHECNEAMADLGMQAARALLQVPEFVRPTGDILVVGSGVYTNMTAIWAFRDHLLRCSPTFSARLYNDPALDECAGYRFVFNDDGDIVDLINLPPPLAG